MHSCKCIATKIILSLQILEGQGGRNIFIFVHKVKSQTVDTLRKEVSLSLGKGKEQVVSQSRSHKIIALLLSSFGSM